MSPISRFDLSAEIVKLFLFYKERESQQTHLQIFTKREREISTNSFWKNKLWLSSIHCRQKLEENITGGTLNFDTKYTGGFQKVMNRVYYMYLIGV